MCTSTLLGWISPLLYVQSTIIASDMGVATDLPAEMELTARNAYRSAAYGAPVSLSHARVVSRLRSLGLKPQVCSSNRPPWHSGALCSQS